MHFSLTTSLSLFLLLPTVSIQSVLGSTPPSQVSKDETYSLTLLANPNRILVSNSHDLGVDTFDATQPWNAADVGPDDSRKWHFYNGLQSLHNAKSNGYLHFQNALYPLKIDGHKFESKYTRIVLVPADEEGGTTTTTNGIKIKLDFGKGHESWVDENGNMDIDPGHAAVWLITKIDGKRIRRARKWEFLWDHYPEN